MHSQNLPAVEIFKYQMIYICANMNSFSSNFSIFVLLIQFLGRIFGNLLPLKKNLDPPLYLYTLSIMFDLG